MNKPLVIDLAQLEVSEKHHNRFFQEASQLGWPPMYVPEEFHVRMSGGTVVTLKLHKEQVTPDGESVEYWKYVGAGISVTIFND